MRPVQSQPSFTGCFPTFNFSIFASVDKRAGNTFSFPLDGGGGGEGAWGMDERLAGPPLGGVGPP